MFNRFLVISISINFAAYLLKWPSKKQRSYVHAQEVPIKFIKSNSNKLLFQNGNCNLVTFFCQVTVTQLLSQSNLLTTGYVQYYARSVTLSSKGEQRKRASEHKTTCRRARVRFKKNCHCSLYAGKNQLCSEITISKTVNTYRLKISVYGNNQ